MTHQKRPLSLIAALTMLSVSLPAAAQGQCRMDMQFDRPEDVRAWQVVNDGVMGGKSLGDAAMQNGQMVFAGFLNTDGGGFSSIRHQLTRGELSDVSALRLRVKSDGRAYKMTFRTDASYYGRSISFQRDIPVTPAGQWAEVDVPLRDMRASIFGRSVRGASFDKSRASQMGIILADGQDGPFKLTVDWIKSCA